jgi:hypothetical protein
MHQPSAGRGKHWGIALLALLGAIGLVGCNQARLVNVWQDPEAKNEHYRSMLVVSQDQDPAARRLWEDQVCAQLARKGVTAVSSYELFPDQSPTRYQMLDAVKSRGLDAAMVLRPLPSTVQTSWVPGWTTTEPRTYYDPWNARSVVVYHERHHRGYRVTDRYAREEITVWSARQNGEMVWAGTAEVANPSSSSELREDLASGVVPEMKKAGMI